MQELSEWNVRYRQKFGFVFLICASGTTSSEILVELQVSLNIKLFVAYVAVHYIEQLMVAESS